MPKKKVKINHRIADRYEKKVMTTMLDPSIHFKERVKTLFRYKQHLNFMRKKNG